jgi:hypothetical protein
LIVTVSRDEAQAVKEKLTGCGRRTCRCVRLPESANVEAVERVVLAESKRIRAAPLIGDRRVAATLLEALDRFNSEF